MAISSLNLNATNTITDLFISLANDSETAFKEIYDLYKVNFFTTAFKMTRSAHTAEEIVQEVFVALWNKRKLVAAAANPFGYLLTILQNSIYTHFRKLAHEQKLKQNLSAQENNESDFINDFLFEKENQQILETIIKKLPPQQQLIYRLSKQEGLNREEIAQQLNLSSNTVRNHLAEAVKFIRRHFNESISSIIWMVILNHIQK